MKIYTKSEKVISLNVFPWWIEDFAILFLKWIDVKDLTILPFHLCNFKVASLREKLKEWCLSILSLTESLKEKWYIMV